MSGYWGTIVVARPSGLLAAEDATQGYGFQHRWLRELGDGWQMLETQGFNDPPDLIAPSRELAGVTGQPVLAAYVSDDHCAVMCAAVPGRVGPLTHLWGVEQPCRVFQHQPSRFPKPAGRTVPDVVTELAQWSAAAGLVAAREALQDLLARPDAQGEAGDLMFELVKALGVARIGRTRPWSVPVFNYPFSLLGGGAALRARSRAAERTVYEEDGDPYPPPEPWETETIALENELYASLYRDDVDVVALARRVVHVCADAKRAQRYRLPEPVWYSIEDRERRTPISEEEMTAELVARFEARWVAGTEQPDSTEVRARRVADARAWNR
ncbi:hypothetical protein FHR83_001979 [Actinoplanes campanulatus]|uniref:Uncharacterized protein n=1 Tax=Actinoplanes campanulatus TaxID=113559 RepID=A0A7W5AE14_9ACTN|nr:hypothetical protein [Actinoplanes campanulatus]MBB3094327.1 hypothetical protein [Actinoplanes campanulatus]